VSHYEPFRDSTKHSNDGKTLRTRLAEDGYLFLRGLLPRQSILDVRTRLIGKAAEGGWLAPGSHVTAGIANQAAACKDPEPAYMSVFRDLWSDESLHRLRTAPAVLALFERICGERALAHPMFVQRNIFPQSDNFDFTTGAHQDRVHIGGATSTAMWMPLGDCPREMGSLAVAAGSHTTGILPTKVGSGAGGMDIAVPIPGTWVTGDFEAGDALIFQDVTVHKSTPAGQARKASITGGTCRSRSCRWIDRTTSGATPWRLRWPRPAIAVQGTRSCVSSSVIRCPRSGNAPGSCWCS
jgi:hypothetical protein